MFIILLYNKRCLFFFRKDIFYFSSGRSPFASQKGRAFRGSSARRFRCFALAPPPLQSLTRLTTLQHESHGMRRAYRVLHSQNSPATSQLHSGMSRTAYAVLTEFCGCKTRLPLRNYIAAWVARHAPCLPSFAFAKLACHFAITLLRGMFLQLRRPAVLLSG